VSETKPLAAAPSADRAGAPSSRGFARSLRDNAIGIFPPQAFEQDVVFRKVFGRRQIIVSRPAAIQRILVDNPENYRRTAAGIRILRPLLGRGLLLSRGEDWRHQRRTLAPAFAPRTMPILCGHVARAAAAATASLEAAAAGPVDLLAAMQFLALEIAGASMFSLEMERYGAELRGLIKAYAARLGRPSLLDFMLPPRVPSPRDVLRWRFRRRWLRLIRRIIAARRAQVSTGDAAGTPRDLFDLMSTARDPESGALFPPERLADQVATMIVAGHETTAVALFWSLYLLAGAPLIQERLAAEVAGADLGPGHAAESLPRLVYTRAVVHEALRLYPPAFTLARQALRPDSAGGIPIAARTVVLIAPWVLHRHRLLWSAPDTFDPERFMPDAPPPGRFAYLPFGIGPRVCIGAQFALTEATLVLATLVQAFRIERADDLPVTPRAIVTTQPDHPPPFLLRPRRPA
jgi:unspecific monooxygenase